MTYLLTSAFSRDILFELPCYSANRGNGLSARAVDIKLSSKELFKTERNSDAAGCVLLKVILGGFSFPGNEAMKGRSQVACFSLAAGKNTLKDKHKLSVNPEAYGFFPDP